MNIVKFLLVFLTLSAAVSCNTVKVRETPEYLAAQQERLLGERLRKKRDAYAKYDQLPEHYALYFSKIIFAADKYDRREISEQEFDAINDMAFAENQVAERQLAAIRDAEYAADRAARAADAAKRAAEQNKTKTYYPCPYSPSGAMCGGF